VTYIMDSKLRDIEDFIKKDNKFVTKMKKVL